MEEFQSILAIEKNRIASTADNKGYWLFHLLDSYKTQQFVRGCNEADGTVDASVDSVEWIEEQILRRSPSGAESRLTHLTVDKFKLLCNRYLGLESIVFCVLGPKEECTESSHL